MILKGKTAWFGIAGLLATVALAIFLAACGGGSGPVTATGYSAEVSIKNQSFNPSDLTISRGTKVTWRNDDDVAHTVSADNRSFDSSRIEPGEIFAFTFDEPGTFTYHCAIHTNMTGKVTVNP